MMLSLPVDAVWECPGGHANPIFRPVCVRCGAQKPSSRGATIKTTVREPQSCVLWLELPVKGKARARVFQDENGDSRARKPADYAEWTRNARRQLEGQWTGRQTLERLERLDVIFWGGSQANDGDNGIGSVMDAMVKAGVVRQDNLKRIPRGSWDWQPADTPRIEVKLSW